MTNPIKRLASRIGAVRLVQILIIAIMFSVPGAVLHIAEEQTNEAETVVKQELEKYSCHDLADLKLINKEFATDTIGLASDEFKKRCNDPLDTYLNQTEILDISYRSVFLEKVKYPDSLGKILNQTNIKPFIT